MYERLAYGSNAVLPLDLDWITFRVHQSYPFADQASGESLQGNMLPQSFLLDINILVPSKKNDNLAGDFYISQLRDLNQTFQLVISFISSNKETYFPVAITQGIPKDLGITVPISKRTYTISAIQQDAQTLQSFPWLNKLTGNICAGLTADYSGGSLKFDVTGTKIHSTCIHFMGGDHLQAIQLDDQYLTGVVKFQAGEGIQFQNIGDNTIKITIDRAYIQQITQGSIDNYLVNQGGSIGTPIKKINGIFPDSQGNIQIQGIDCVRIDPIGHGITINNPCAKPCCSGNASLDGVSASIDILKEEQKILRQYYINMSTVVNYMQANLSTLMTKN